MNTPTKLRVVLALVLVCFSGFASAQDDDVVTLGDVLAYNYPGVEWVLEERVFPEDHEITIWRDDRPKPVIADLEEKRGQPQRRTA